ncbi:MAG: hypothetical protein ACSLFP_07960 [Acidimicrobiales bacterium]
MTTTHPAAATAERSHEPAAVSDLRRFLVAEAAVTAALGAGMLVGTDALADRSGLATTGPVLAVGAFFVALPVVLAILSRAPQRLLLRLAPLNAAGDLAWAAASFGVAALADLSTTGRVLVAGQGILVVGIGEAKLLLARRARRSTTMAR